MVKMKNKRPSPYHLKNVFSHKEYFDWYDFIDATRATGIILDPRIEHVQKKLFVNDRGHKNEIKDIKESIQTLQMMLEKLEINQSTKESKDHGAMRKERKLNNSNHITLNFN